uniref:RNase H family protein n=1 Tax=Streptococcus pluranimalium TaxID=82348 RepID=UPI003F68F7C6
MSESGTRLSSYTLYTDGSYKSKSDFATAAFVLLDDSGNVLLKGRYDASKEGYNRKSLLAELKAIIDGLKHTKHLIDTEEVNITIITDYNELVRFHRTRRKRNKRHPYYKEKFSSYINLKEWNWYHSNLSNVEKKYSDVGIRLNLSVKWVKGHDGDQWNEYVDNLASRKRSK